MYGNEEIVKLEDGEKIACWAVPPDDNREGRGLARLSTVCFTYFNLKLSQSN